MAKSNSGMPKPTQNEPHVPCMAAAIASRALTAHVPAANRATPPKAAANGNRHDEVFESPCYPASSAATISVEPAKA